jgi:hypothetical protein
MLVTEISTIYSEKHIHILFGQNREFFNQVLMSLQVVPKEQPPCRKENVQAIL